MSLRDQGTTLFSAILVLVTTTFSIQLWLLTFCIEALLRRQYGSLLPAALASTGLLGVNALLMRFVQRFDREVNS